MNIPYRAARFLCVLLCLTPFYLKIEKETIAATSGKAGPVHAYTPHGSVKYAPDFPHFDYVNPDAPKGGSIVLEGTGTFDSFNGYIIKGNPAQGLGLTYDSLMTSSADEPFSMYGLLAEWMEIAPDHSAVRFKLRDQARFHDGKPVTAADVVWSFNILVEKGAPLFRFYYADVMQVEAESQQIVRFDLKPGLNIELPGILGQIPVFPAHYWQDKDFSDPTLDPPLGSGPYKIADFKAGSYVIYERDPAYWGQDLPVNRGQYNFDQIRYDFYRDRTISREAFKARKLSFWRENSAKEWATAFDTDSLRDGTMKRKEFPHSNVAPMQGFTYNMRRDLFQDPVLREALTYAFDFEWASKSILYNAYKRTESFFGNSELAARGEPSPEELKILEPLRDQLPPRVFGPTWQAPVSDGSGQNRRNLRLAANMLKEAGWRLQDGLLTHEATGRKLEFELLLRSETFAPHAQIFVRGVERLGGKVSLRVVDDAQYLERLRSHDFDMIIAVFAQSQSPGNEQREFWSSAAADAPSGRNLAGLKSPAIDVLVEGVISASDRAALVTHVRALDRALQWQFLTIPMYYSDSDRLAWWDIFDQPDMIPSSGTSILYWWIKPDSAS